MKKLHYKVNLIPVLAKTDAMTVEEVKLYRDKVRFLHYYNMRFSLTNLSIKGLGVHFNHDTRYKYLPDSWHVRTRRFLRAGTKYFALCPGYRKYVRERISLPFHRYPPICADLEPRIWFDVLAFNGRYRWVWFWWKCQGLFQRKCQRRFLNNRLRRFLNNRLRRFLRRNVTRRLIPFAWEKWVNLCMLYRD